MTWLSPSLLGEPLLLSTWELKLQRSDTDSQGALPLSHYLSGKLLFLIFRFLEEEKFYLTVVHCV